MFFASRAEADLGQKSLLDAIQEQGKAHPMFSKSASDLLVEELQQHASMAGLSLREAVKEAVDARRASTGISLHALAESYLETLEEKSASHKRDAHRIVSSMMAHLGDVEVDAISPLDYEAWLEARASSSPYNWNLHVAHTKALFAWGIRRRLCKLAPSDAVKKKRIEVEEIRILSPEEAQRIVELVREHAPDTLLAWAMLMFAGVRPAELSRLTLTDINLEERVIKVSAKNSKTKTMRLIQIEDNLFELIGSWGYDFITPVNWGRKYRALRKMAGIAEYQDICRHSYASYHYGKYRDMGLLLENMGHSTQQVTLKHYKTPPKPSDVEKYWAVLSQGRVNF